MLQPEELAFFCQRCGDDDCEIGADFCGACMGLLAERHERMLTLASRARSKRAAEGYLHLAYLVRQMHFDAEHFPKELLKDLSAKPHPSARPNEQN